VGPLYQIAWIAKRKRDHGWSRCQCKAECLLIERLRHMIDRKMAVGKLLHKLNVAFDCRRGPEERSDSTEATCIRDGSC
jgi:hypothetical protein